MEARNCRSGQRKNGTQIGLIGKTENHIGYVFFAKTENQIPFEIPFVNQKLTFDERISCITRHDDFLKRSNRCSFPQRLQRQKLLSRSSNRSNRTENDWVYCHLIQVNLKFSWTRSDTKDNSVVYHNWIVEKNLFSLSAALPMTHSAQRK